MKVMAESKVILKSDTGSRNIISFENWCFFTKHLSILTSRESHDRPESQKRRATKQKARIDRHLIARPRKDQNFIADWATSSMLSLAQTKSKYNIHLLTFVGQSVESTAERLYRNDPTIAFNSSASGITADNPISEPFALIIKLVSPHDEAPT